MEKQKVLMATYKTLKEAQQVVGALEQNNFERGDIGLAVRDDKSKTSIDNSEVLVTVSAKAEDMIRIQKLLLAYQPMKIDIRDMQWRLNEKPIFEPNADNFIALERAEK